MAAFFFQQFTRNKKENALLVCRGITSSPPWRTCENAYYQLSHISNISAQLIIYWPTQSHERTFDSCTGPHKAPKIVRSLSAGWPLTSSYRMMFVLNVQHKFSTSCYMSRRILYKLFHCSFTFYSSLYLNMRGRSSKHTVRVRIKTF